MRLRSIRNTPAELSMLVCIGLFASGLVSSAPVLAGGPTPAIYEFSHKIDPRYLPEGYVRLGDGVDMRDLAQPVLTTTRAFGSVNVVEADTRFSPGSTGEWAHSQVADTSVFRQSLSHEEETEVLAGYFKTTYGLTSAKAAGSHTSASTEDHESVYILIEHRGNTQRVNPASLIWDWRKKPRSELMGSDGEVLAQFLSEYGSHYVSTITYGMRIGIRGTIRFENEDEKEKFSAAMKTTFCGFSAKGGISVDKESMLHQSNVEVILEVTSGGAVPARPLLLTGIDDIYRFVNDLRARSHDDTAGLAFRLAPISASLKSYWSLLPTNWERTRAVLRPEEAYYTIAGTR